MTLRPAILLALVALPLVGCGNQSNLSRSFGFTRDAPDEFQVQTRAPLSMPPSMADLPAPRPGAPRPQEISARQQAEAVLTPNAALSARAGAGRTAGESALIAASGRGAPADIRDRIDQDSLRINAADRNLTERLMFWREPSAPGTAVDPAREAQRLRENAALGREVTDGETPIIQRPSTGTFMGGLRLF